MNLRQTRRKTIVALVIFLFATVPGLFLAFAWSLGLFASVQISEAQRPAMQVLALQHEGDYQRVGEKIMMMKRAIEPHIKCGPVALYYDDGQRVAKNAQRSKGGCLVARWPQAPIDGAQRIAIPAARALLFTIDAHPSIAMRKIMRAVRSRVGDAKLPLIARFSDEGEVELFADL